MKEGPKRRLGYPEQQHITDHKRLVWRAILGLRIACEGQQGMIYRRYCCPAVLDGSQDLTPDTESVCDVQQLICAFLENLEREDYISRWAYLYAGPRCSLPLQGFSNSRQLKQCA